MSLHCIRNWYTHTYTYTYLHPSPTHIYTYVIFVTIYFYITKIHLEIMVILLLWPSECWDHRHKVPRPADSLVFEQCLLSVCESPVSCVRCDRRSKEPGKQWQRAPGGTGHWHAGCAAKPAYFSQRDCRARVCCELVTAHPVKDSAENPDRDGYKYAVCQQNRMKGKWKTTHLSKLYSQYLPNCRHTLLI